MLSVIFFLLVLWCTAIGETTAGVLDQHFRLLERRANRTIYGPVVPMEDTMSTFWKIELWFDHHIKVAMRRFIQFVGWTRTYPVLSAQYSEIQPGVYLGSIPLNSIVLEDLWTKHQVTNVVNFLHPMEYQDTEGLYDTFGFDELRVPTYDHAEPRVEDYAAAVDFLRWKLHDQNESVFVHCLSGRTRSAGAVMAYLATLNTTKSYATIHQQLLQARPIVNHVLLHRPNLQTYRQVYLRGSKL